MTQPPQYQQQPNQPGGQQPGAMYGGQQFNAGPRPRVGFGRALKNWWRYIVRFQGRASRSEYWWVALTAIVVDIAVGIGGSALLNPTVSSTSGSGSTGVAVSGSASGASAGGVGIMILIVILIGLSMIPLTVRRLHDANLAGPMYFLILIPTVGALILLILTLLPSKPEGQRFDGPDDVGRP